MPMAKIKEGTYKYNEHITKLLGLKTHRFARIATFLQDHPGV